MRAKGRINQAVVPSILLHGCETWLARVADERMLEVFDNDNISHILVGLVTLQDIVTVN